MRKALDEVAAEWSIKMNTEIQQTELDARKALSEQYGIQVHYADPAVVDEIVAKVSPYWEEWADQTGPEAQALLKEIRQAVGR